MADEGFAQPWVEFEKEFGARPIIHGPLSSCVDGFIRIGGLMASKYIFPPPDSSVKAEDRTTDDGLKVRVYTPLSSTFTKGSKPIGIYYHGGGWAMGDLDGDDASCRAISKAADAVVVSIAYGLAPNPGLMDDCWKGLKYAVGHAEELGAKPAKFFTAGVSAGGQLALGMALKAIDEGMGEDLTGVVALVPATVHYKAVPEELKGKWTSYEEHAEHTINSKSAMETFWDAFDPSPTDPYASPLLHPKIAELKKVYIAVAGHDTLRDDGLLFHEKLQNASVPTNLDVYKGYPHYHWTWPSSKLDEPRKEFLENMDKGIKFVLE